MVIHGEDLQRRSERDFALDIHLLSYPNIQPSVNMWRPATREVTGTNESKSVTSRYPFAQLTGFTAPLGNRRRFGPAPVEEAAPPQLAQPSPSAYPRAPPSDRESSRHSRDDSPASNSATRKYSTVEQPRMSRPPPQIVLLTTNLASFALQLVIVSTDPNHILTSDLAYILQRTQMPLANVVAGGEMLRRKYLACPQQFLLMVSPRLTWIIMQSIFAWKRLTGSCA